MKPWMIKSAIVAGFAVASFGLLIGCGVQTHTDAPDPAPADVITGTHQMVFKNPDGFRNVAFSCNGTVGMYVTSRGTLGDTLSSSISTVPNDPACK